MLDREKTKRKKANYALQHVRTDSRCIWMKNVLNLSEAPIIQEPAH